MKNKSIIPFAAYGLGVSISLCVMAIADSTTLIVVSALVAAFFAYRLYKSR